MVITIGAATTPTTRASFSSSELAARFGGAMLAIDLLWLLPFSLVLWGAVQHHHAVGSAYETPEADVPQYAMADVPRISDPQCRLYRQFGLDLGEFRQLFGLRFWLRGIGAGVVHGHVLGWPRSNSFQMPGVFTYFRGQVIEGFQHAQASDRPVYVVYKELKRT